MRIGIDLTTSVGVQGTEVFACELLRVAARIAVHHEWFVYVTSPALRDRMQALDLPSSRVRIRQFPHGGVLRRALNQQGLLWKAARADGIEFLYAPSPFFCWAWRGKAAVTIHDCAYARYPEYRSLASRVYIQACIFLARLRHLPVYTVSAFSKSELMQLYAIPASRIIQLTEGVPELPTPLPVSAAWREKHGVPGEYVLHIGTHRPRKNIPRLIEAFALFRKTHPEVQLVFAGPRDDSFGSVPSEARRWGLEGAVVQVGYLTEQEKANVLAGAMAFAFPSLYEGFGLPVLEAQQLGTPVVVARASSLPEVAGEGAVYCDPLNVQSIADALELVGRPDVRAAVTLAGYNNVRRYSWKAGAKVFLHSLVQYENSARK